MPNLIVHVILAALVWASSSLWSPGRSRDADVRQAPFSVGATRDPDLSLRLRWTIAPGTYLYRDRIGASAVAGQWLPVHKQTQTHVAQARRAKTLEHRDADDEAGEHQGRDQEGDEGLAPGKAPAY
ncbi:protein-disulfide reductase DsbD domain-containing protein, partial [Methylobacterium radiotolerans]|uniref:protein-disulfide reductase DsbD domain-containing protein n=1 Tax=Methylobacterium radiotolerans TaxID=31998 RepID=UPI0009C83F6A